MLRTASISSWNTISTVGGLPVFCLFVVCCCFFLTSLHSSPCPHHSPKGIDIDWEYPGYVDHSGTPQDRDNFKLLLNDVRSKLDELGAQTGKFYGLTAALPCGPNHISNMDIAHVASTLSQLNLMTYGEFLYIVFCLLCILLCRGYLTIRFGSRFSRGFFSNDWCQRSHLRPRLG